MDPEEELQTARDAASAEFEKAMLPIQQKYDAAMAEADAKFMSAMGTQESEEEESEEDMELHGDMPEEDSDD